MKVGAISSLQQSRQIVHMDTSIQPIQEGSSKNNIAPLSATAPIKPVQRNDVNLGMTEATRLIRSEEMDSSFLFNAASSTPVVAQNKNVNIVSEPDAVAQEMLQNLRASMSQSPSADTETSNVGHRMPDITMPDHKMSVSAKHIQTAEEDNERFPPLVLDTLTDTNKIKNVMDDERLTSALLETEEKSPVLAKNDLESPPPSLMTQGLIQPTPDQLFTPNYTSDLPKNPPPMDIPLSVNSSPLERTKDFFQTMSRLQSSPAQLPIEEVKNASKLTSSFSNNVSVMDFPSPPRTEYLEIQTQNPLDVYNVEQKPELMQQEYSALDPIRTLQSTASSQLVKTITDLS